MKKLFLFAITIILALQACAQQQNVVAHRVMALDSIYLNGVWIKKIDVDRWNSNQGDGGSVYVDSLYLRSDSLFYMKDGAEFGIEIPPQSWDDIVGKPVFASVATTGNYLDLSGRPTIPTKVSDLANDLNFAAINDGASSTSTTYSSSKINSLIAGAGGGDMMKSVYDPTGISGDAFDYRNFTHTPTIPLQFNPIAGTGISLSGTYPNITINGFSGAYGDLTGTPTIPVIPAKMPTAEAQAGTATTQRTIDAATLKAAIEALAPAGGSGTDSAVVATGPLTKNVSGRVIILGIDSTSAGGIVTNKALHDTLNNKFLMDTTTAGIAGSIGSSGGLIQVNGGDNSVLKNVDLNPDTTSTTGLASKTWVQNQGYGTGGGTSTTNLGIGTRTSTTVPITSSTGTSATFPAATTSLAGAFTAPDKTKLDGIAAGAEVNVQGDLAQTTTSADDFIKNKNNNYIVNGKGYITHADAASQIADSLSNHPSGIDSTIVLTHTQGDARYPQMAEFNAPTHDTIIQTSGTGKVFGNLDIHINPNARIAFPGDSVDWPYLTKQILADTAAAIRADFPTGGGGSGVSSVGLGLPTSVFSVTGSPITTTGTLTGAFKSQTTNTVFASPDGSAGVPSFRALMESDVPALSASKISSGVFSTSRLGTGTASSTTYLRGDGTWATISTGGTGTVTSVNATVPTGLSVSGGPITGSGTLAFSYASGYSIPTIAKQTSWDAKFSTPTGTTSQYIRGDGSLATFPTIPTVTNLGNANLTNTASQTRTFNINGGTLSFLDNTAPAGATTRLSLHNDNTFMGTTSSDGNYGAAISLTSDISTNNKVSISATNPGGNTTLQVDRTNGFSLSGGPVIMGQYKNNAAGDSVTAFSTTGTVKQVYNYGQPGTIIQHKISELTATDLPYTVTTSDAYLLIGQPSSTEADNTITFPNAPPRSFDGRIVVIKNATDSSITISTNIIKYNGAPFDAIVLAPGDVLRVMVYNQTWWQL